MKNFVTIILVGILLPGIPLSAMSENINATVYGSSVTLNDWSAVRNCGSQYIMEIDQDGYHISWIQRDTGMMAVCLCTFNYSVTYGPLECGTYEVDVYVTEPGNTTLFWVGSTSFIIMEPITDTTLVYSQYTSDCMGFQSLEDPSEKKVNLLGENRPNPFIDHTLISINGNSESGQHLMIWNSMGKLVRMIPLNSQAYSEIIFSRNDDQGRSLPAGVYFYGLIKDSRLIIKKMLIQDD